mmetsp:Transcript_87957/g.165811  ORF Transcript_87957/g.165811 Transcript_87957/m.165811 type:complete len:218 (-) Transcript_87957:69-722(-)
MPWPCPLQPQFRRISPSCSLLWLFLWNLARRARRSMRLSTRPWRAVRLVDHQRLDCQCQGCRWCLCLGEWHRQLLKMTHQYRQCQAAMQSCQCQAAKRCFSAARAPFGRFCSSQRDWRCNHRQQLLAVPPLLAAADSAARAPRSLEQQETSGLVRLRQRVALAVLTRLWLSLSAQPGGLCPLRLASLSRVARGAKAMVERWALQASQEQSELLLRLR